MDPIHASDTIDSEPTLYIVEPRKLRNAISSRANSLEEVVIIGGKFTVSF